MSTFNPKLLTAYYAQHKQHYSDNHVFPSRTVTTYELSYLINVDTCQVSLDNQLYHLKGDTVIYRSPGQINQSFMPYESILLRFDLDGYDDHPLIKDLPSIHQGKSIHSLRKVFEDIYKESFSNRPHASIYQSAKITEILYEISQHTDAYLSLHDAPITNPHLLTVLKYIDQSLDHPFTISSMSKDLSMSERHIYHLFKEHMTTTPIKYINECRLNLSKGLLSTSNLPVHQIASLSGYENANYFITLFRKTFNITPTKYRKHHIGDW